MKLFNTTTGLIVAAMTLSAVTVFAAEGKSVPTETEIVFVPQRSCSALPADIQEHTLACDQVTVGKRTYAKVKIGYAPFERQEKEAADLSTYN